MARDKLHPRMMRVQIYPDQMEWLISVIAASKRDDKYVSEASVVRAAIDELASNGGYKQIKQYLGKQFLADEQ